MTNLFITLRSTVLVLVMLCCLIWHFRQLGECMLPISLAQTCSQLGTTMRELCQSLCTGMRLDRISLCRSQKSCNIYSYFFQNLGSNSSPIQMHAHPPPNTRTCTPSLSWFNSQYIFSFVSEENNAPVALIQTVTLFWRWLGWEGGKICHRVLQLLWMGDFVV